MFGGRFNLFDVASAFIFMYEKLDEFPQHSQNFTLYKVAVFARLFVYVYVYMYGVIVRVLIRFIGFFCRCRLFYSVYHDFLSYMPATDI